jgi:hypothetical protein
MQLFSKGNKPEIASKLSDNRLLLRIIQEHKKELYLVITVMTSALIVGYLLSIIQLSNNSIGSIFNPLSTYKTGPGVINGYAYDRSGLPNKGATIIAAEQGGLYKTINMVVSPDGKYVFPDLNPGQYIIIAVFSDGIYKVLDNIKVEPGSIQTIDFEY